MQLTVYIDKTGAVFVQAKIKQATSKCRYLPTSGPSANSAANRGGNFTPSTSIAPEFRRHHPQFAQPTTRHKPEEEMAVTGTCFWDETKRDSAPFDRKRRQFRRERRLQRREGFNTGRSYICQGSSVNICHFWDPQFTTTY